MVPEVSIVLPTYNRAEWIVKAIDSILSQEFSSWELLIINDGSTDETESKLKGYLGNPSIKLLNTSNRGVSAARNLGIEKSRGDLIAFIDSDDQWEPQKLSLQVQFLKKYPEVPLVHGEEIWIRNGVRVNPMKKHKKSGGDVFADALKLCCISPSTVLLRRSLLNEVGYFREDFPVCEDYDLWLKITSQYQIGFIDEALITKFGGHEDQLSRKFKAMDYWRVLAIHDLLEKGHLSSEQISLAKAELLEKATVLLKGYRKHENLENYDTVFEHFCR